MKVEIKTTADGSSTLYVPELKENYHSINGAVEESMHVFIRTGLLHLPANTLNILEVGFGTGLNAMLTLIYSKEIKQVNYHGIELFPLEWVLINKLEYPAFLNLTSEQASCFERMHRIPWGHEIEITPGFMLHKYHTSFTNITFTKTYQLVYFDAFAPMVQPELWTEAVFTRLFNTMSPGGILVTYCAKGEVRRCMQRAGFTVERLPGPPGKREILRARKPGG